MTEAEWNSCTDVQAMLEWLGQAGKADERKLRLFACACGRRVWQLLKDAESRAAVEVAERFADGLERKSTLAAARSRARRAAVAQRGAAYVAWRAAFEKIQAAIVHLALGTVWSASYRPWFGVLAADMDDVECEQAAVAALLREIFGNPFRRIAVGRTWLTPTVTNLAKNAYEERALPSGELDIARFGVLADALEETGYDNEEILSHLRQQGAVHVRGCWAIDLLFNKV